MPFDFLRRRKGEADGGATADGGAVAEGERGVPFDGMTEEWRLVGTMQVEGRLSDAVNRREPITLSEVNWAPIDGSAPMTPVPGLKTIDPYDLILIMAGQTTLPTMSDADKVAHRVHKVSYDVGIEIPPFRVVGTVLLYPGSDPNRLLDRATEMFVPVVQATAYHGTRIVADRNRRDPDQPLLPARGGAGRPGDGGAPPEAARPAARRDLLAGPVALRAAPIS